MISNLCARMGLFALLLVASSTSILTQEKPKDTKSKDKAKGHSNCTRSRPDARLRQVISVGDHWDEVSRDRPRNNGRPHR
jgi:hypothetical protein